MNEELRQALGRLAPMEAEVERLQVEIEREEEEDGLYFDDNPKFHAALELEKRFYPDFIKLGQADPSFESYSPALSDTSIAYFAEWYEEVQAEGGQES